MPALSSSCRRVSTEIGILGGVAVERRIAYFGLFENIDFDVDVDFDFERRGRDVARYVSTLPWVYPAQEAVNAPKSAERRAVMMSRKVGFLNALFGVV